LNGTGVLTITLTETGTPVGSTYHFYIISSGSGSGTPQIQFTVAEALNKVYGFGDYGDSSSPLQVPISVVNGSAISGCWITATLMPEDHIGNVGWFVR